MPSSENIKLETVSSPSPSRHRDPEGETIASRDVSSSVHLGDPTPLEAVVVSNPGDSADETDETDAENNKFRPGYEEGLLVILRNFARLVESGRGRWDFGWDTSEEPFNFHHIEEHKNLDWARATLTAIKNRDDGILPQLSTNVSHLLLKRLVFQVNRSRHISECPSRRVPREGLSSRLSQPDPPGSGLSITSRLFRVFHTLSAHLDQLQAWHSLKKEADAMTTTCPLQSSLRVTVCDFGDGEYQKFDTTLGTLTGFGEKPAWVRLRWIHIPSGKGAMQKMLPDVLHNMERQLGLSEHRADQNMLNNGFSCDFLALCDAGWVVRQTRNWVRFSDNGDLRDYLQTMNRTALDGAWLRREGRGGPWRLFREWQSGESYWDVARSLIPREIGGNNYIDSRGDANFALSELPPQNTSNLVLSGTLFRDTLKAVCVSDHVLTMSALAFPKSGREECPCGMYKPTDKVWSGHECRLLDTIYRQFSIYKVRHLDPKWFLTYLATEFMRLSAVNMDWGAPNLQDAYAPVIQEMRSRRHSSGNAVKLVRKIVKLIDEISQIQYLNDEKIGFLNKLRRESEQYEQKVLERAQYDPEYVNYWTPPIQTTTKMIDQALYEIGEKNNRFPQYLRDLRSNLDVIFQLASIEQNELSLKADKNNRAILVFTIVTIIFLPLSFFTSYFGMNIQGIANSDKSQHDFWVICGTSTALIVGLTVLYGFKESVQTRFFSNRKKAKALDESLLAAGIKLPE